MTDIGNRDFYATYASPDKNAALKAALSLLPRLQAARSPAMVHYDHALVATELAVFSEWFVGRWLGIEFPAATLDSVWQELIQNFADQPQVCVHLDYHSRNLLFSEGGNLGVVDFQDCRLGPLSYDIASLLRDCYFEFDEVEVEHWRSEFLDQYNQRTQSAQIDAQTFAQQFDLTAIQRQLKAVGIFVRLWLRDGKNTHLQHLPRTLTSLHNISGNYEQTLPLHEFLKGLTERSQERLAQETYPVLEPHAPSVTQSRG